MKCNNKTNLPDKTGHYGIFGGKYVPETLIQALVDLENEYNKIKNDKAFNDQLNYLFKDYVGRPSPLYKAEQMAKAIGTKAKVYLKREDLNHTGAHKINNTLGQALLAKRLKKTRIIAETGAGQHGVATATAAALLGLECEVYMGEEDIDRQRLNVFRMELLGARVVPVSSGTKTLKDATNEAMRDWMTNVKKTHYIIGSVVGPHPFPMIVRDFQSVIGREAKKQIMEKEKRLPDYLIACVGGGSNSIGLFNPFYNDKDVKFIGVEAAGRGLSSGEHAASITIGDVGVFHGSRNFVLQTDDGQIKPAHSISAGLDYPGTGPEHCFYQESGRADYVSITDDEAMKGVELLCRTEGIIPALESAHAIAYTSKMAMQKKLKASDIVIICLSGRGDKDVFTYEKYFKENKK